MIRTPDDGLEVRCSIQLSYWHMMRRRCTANILYKRAFCLSIAFNGSVSAFSSAFLEPSEPRFRVSFHSGPSGNPKRFPSQNHHQMAILNLLISVSLQRSWFRPFTETDVFVPRVLIVPCHEASELEGAGLGQAVVDIVEGRIIDMALPLPCATLPKNGSSS